MHSGTAELYQSIWNELREDKQIGDKIKCNTQDISKLFLSRGQTQSTSYQSAIKFIKILVKNDIAIKKVGYGKGGPLEGLIVNDADFNFSSLVSQREKRNGNGKNGSTNSHNDDLEERLRRLENIQTIRADNNLKPGCIVMIDFDNINIYCQNMGFYFQEFWNNVVTFLNDKYKEPIKMAIAVVSEKTPQSLLGNLVRMNMKVMFGPRFKTFQKTDTVDEHIKTTINFFVENTMIKSYAIVSRDTDFIPTLSSIQQSGRSSIRIKPDDKDVGYVVFTIGSAELGRVKLEKRSKKRAGLNVDNALAAVDAYMGDGKSFHPELDDVTKSIAKVLKQLGRDDPRPFLELKRMVSERIKTSVGDRDIKFILEAFISRGFIRRVVKNNITVYSIDPRLV